jgi:hypothetical protein
MIRITSLFALLLVIFSYNNAQTASENPEKVTFSFGPGYCYSVFLGDNYYHTSHEDFPGLYFQASARIIDRVYISYRFGRNNGKITDNSIFFAEKTRLTHDIFQLGYVWRPVGKVIVQPFISYDFIKGKNQGKFKGRGYGGGVAAEYYLGRWMYLSAGLDLQKVKFNIKAPEDVQSKFSDATQMSFSVGFGVSFP